MLTVVHTCNKHAGYRRISEKSLRRIPGEFLGEFRQTFLLDSLQQMHSFYAAPSLCVYLIHRSTLVLLYYPMYSPIPLYIHTRPPFFPDIWGRCLFLGPSTQLGDGACANVGRGSSGDLSQIRLSPGPAAARSGPGPVPGRLMRPHI